MDKFRLLRDHLVDSGLTLDAELLRPELCPVDILALAHDRSYIERYMAGELAREDQRRLGLPWSEALARRTVRAVGGSLLAAEQALEHGLACHLAGGTHHAHYDHPAGFCIFNDLAIISRYMLESGRVNRVLIFDCDVHQGDGTARILEHTPDAITVSLHCEKNFPARKAQSDWDIGLPMGMGDAEYLQVVDEALNYLLPLLINLVLFVGLIYFAGHQFSLWVDTLMPTLPNWLGFLNYVLWPLFVVLVALMVFFTFTMLANIIAAPFNGFLSEKVEAVARGVDTSPPFSWGELAAMVPRTLTREMRKLGYFLPRAIALLILSFIPVLNLIAAPLWLLFGIWMMAIQYIDYPADNHKLGWNEMLAWLREKRWQSMSFGGIVYLVLLIPVVNILMMPAAVAGATLFWVRERGDEALAAANRSR